jgi:hypothetical protein
MLYFERGKDPKDTLDVGAKKDATKITGIGYFLKSAERHIENPEKAKIFLDRLKSGDLPNDPIFGIESVFVWYDEISPQVDYAASMKRSMRGSFGVARPDGFEPTQYNRSKNTKTYELEDIAGKVLDMCGKLMIFPTLEELEKSGFGYLEKFLEGEIMKREEDSRIEKGYRDEVQRLAEEERKKHLEELNKRIKAEEEIAKDQKELEKKIESDYYIEQTKKGIGVWLKDNWDVFNNGDKIT